MVSLFFSNINDKGILDNGKADRDTEHAKNTTCILSVNVSKQVNAHLLIVSFFFHGPFYGVKNKC